jgi:isochorismate hydrolase
LKAHDRHTLILTGMEAHICVAQTALQAPLDYRIVVIADAVASRSPLDRDMALERLRENGVTIMSTEMLMYEWLERAGTDTFRAALPLLK